MISREIARLGQNLAFLTSSRIRRTTSTGGNGPGSVLLRHVLRDCINTGGRGVGIAPNRPRGQKRPLLPQRSSRLLAVRAASRRAATGSEGRESRARHLKSTTLTGYQTQQSTTPHTTLGTRTVQHGRTCGAGKGWGDERWREPTHRGGEEGCLWGGGGVSGWM